MCNTKMKQENVTIPTKKRKKYCLLENTPWVLPQEALDLTLQRDARIVITHTSSR